MKKSIDKCINGIKQNAEIAYCFQSTITAQVAVAAVWVVRGLFQLIVDYRTKRMNGRVKDCVFAAVIFLLPQIVIHLYTLVLVLLDQTNAAVLSTNAVTYAALALTIVAIYLFGRTALGYIFYALALSWFLCLIRSVLELGPTIITDAISQGWFGVSLGYENYLELDAVVFSVGYGILLFLFSKKETNLQVLTLYAMLAIIFLIGVKRIAILAVLLVVVCYLIVFRKNEEKAYKVSVIAGWIAVVGCVAFIQIYHEQDKILTALPGLWSRWRKICDDAAL